MDKTKVILIGGTSGAGKTTLGRTLAIKLGITSLTIDDLMIATRAVTTPKSHPGLHIMSTGDSYEYFTKGPVEKLIADAKTQHQATWPAVKKVIQSHAAWWGSPIVIDGWAMHPDWVAGLGLDNVRSFWIVIDPDVLARRERQNTEFLKRSSDPDRMYEMFMGRSLWYNDYVKQEAGSLGLNVLHQDGSVTTEELIEQVLQAVD